MPLSSSAQHVTCSRSASSFMRSSTKTSHDKGFQWTTSTGTARSKVGSSRCTRQFQPRSAASIQTEPTRIRRAAVRRTRS
jgi:hypothetical protein